MIGQDRPGALLPRERGAGRGWLGYLRGKNEWHLRSRLSLELAVAGGWTPAVFVPSLWGTVPLPRQSCGWDGAANHSFLPNPLVTGVGI